MSMDIYTKLLEVQCELIAPKDKDNDYGGYKYRSAEQILECVKPILKKHGLTMFINDDVVAVGEEIFIKAVVSITDGEATLIGSAFARIDKQKKGMDAPQATGAASSYARKYALGGLLLIDDTKDNDSNEHRKECEARLLKEHMEYIDAKGIEVEFLLSAYKVDKVEKITEGMWKSICAPANLDRWLAEQDKWKNAKGKEEKK